MAEGLARELGREVNIESYSAGLIPAGVNPYAIMVMREMGIDIFRQRSKTFDEELLNQMDVIITLCDNAESACPKTPPHIRRIHWPIDDPIRAIGTEENILKEFRRARDEIKGKIIGFIEELK